MVLTASDASIPVLVQNEADTKNESQQETKATMNVTLNLPSSAEMSQAAEEELRLVRKLTGGHDDDAAKTLHDGAVDSDAEEDDDLPQAVRDERRHLERDVRAIMAWSNTFLKQRGMQVQSIRTDFRDGVHLINLLEVAYHERVGTYNPKPKRNYHKIDNLNVAFAYMEKEQGIKLINLNPVDVANGVIKPTLAALMLLLRALAVDSMTGFGGGKPNKNMTVRQHLLKWVKDSFTSAESTTTTAESSSGTSPSATNSNSTSLEITNFWEAFQDGIAFSAIIEKLCPGSIDVDSLDPANAEQNLANAFRIAEEKLDIPALLSPEDLLRGRPDERAVESYVSMLVSAAAGTRKKHEEMAKKAELMAEIREQQRQNS